MVPGADAAYTPTLCRLGGRRAVPGRRRHRARGSERTPWITATVAGLATFLAGLRRIVSWHDDWLAASEARAKAVAEIAQYRLRPPAERTPQRQQELVAVIDGLVLTETRSWGRRRREKAQSEATA
ncbi:hypothetical protein [Paractinoplanes durhamensis]|uniref:hypothetical protein n=1 Tax=Paractinoplanes durhamensis TaxID=113563 RepID=UPI0036304F75